MKNNGKREKGKAFGRVRSAGQAGRDEADGHILGHIHPQTDATRRGHTQPLMSADGLRMHTDGTPAIC